MISINNTKIGRATIGLSVLLFFYFLVSPNITNAEGCHTGAVAIANAYVRLNPAVEYFFGSIEDYVRENRSHFMSGGDAIVCAKQLESALSQGAFQAYDPQFQQQRDQLNAELGAMGLSPGQQPMSASAQLYGMARNLNRLAYALPYAADENYGPLWTPRDQTEQMQIFAVQMFRTMLAQDPSIRSALSHAEAQIRELANIEYRNILNIARQLD